MVINNIFFISTTSLSPRRTATLTTYGDDGSSRSVADISASMIWPGVISMGIPRSGVGGRGGVVGREMREPRLESDTGEVGRLTVTGTLELRVRLKH